MPSSSGDVRSATHSRPMGSTCRSSQRAHPGELSNDEARGRSESSGQLSFTRMAQSFSVLNANEKLIAADRVHRDFS